MKHLSINAFKEILKVEHSNHTVAFINVCTPIEFKEKHIRGVTSMPLDELAYRYKELMDKKTIYVHCKSGRRSIQAIEKLSALGITAELVNIEGGLNAWEEANLPTGKSTKKLPIIRQVFITAGAMILIGAILSIVYPELIMIPIFVSAGLIFAGITGWCGLAKILEKLPWNR
jgi:rhodanese-related sulfurtransferase